MDVVRCSLAMIASNASVPVTPLNLSEYSSELEQLNTTLAAMRNVPEPLMLMDIEDVPKSTRL